ncbi:MAG: fluoride efflux transporter CrcB [Tractidigestivibacter sp.]|jgi:CrcB protein|uniref:fluoride efflux transporter CrcB n=1 Tax=Tractidigestivibacter sp. TaxID=2847320 RepID=UPI003D8E85BA
MGNFALVGIGGAIGAMLRYALTLVPFGTSFPFATFLANVIGAFAIGLISGLSTKGFLSNQATLLLKTGVCGGFTTFSTFSLESTGFIEDGAYGLAAIYVVSSIISCFVGVALGELLSRQLA